MESEEDHSNRSEHAKFLLYQLEQDVNSSKLNKNCLIQCCDGAYLTSSLILCSLSKKISQLLKEMEDFMEQPLIIIPSLDLGEILLFFKYFFSNKVEEMFNNEDTMVLQKVINELEIDFDHHKNFLQEERISEAVVSEEPDVNVNSRRGHYKCYICVNHFRSQELLSKHILLDHPQSSKSLLNQCKFCNEIFLTEDECNSHIDQAHQNNVVKNAEKLFRERRLQQLEKLKSDVSCKFCCETVNFSLLSKHIKQKHPENEHTCLNCGKINKNREDLEQHIQVHADANEWYLKCERCPKICLSQYQLQLHKKSHNIKQFGRMTCPHCDRVFQIADKFKKHVESHESGKFDKSFPCVHCTKTFKKQYDLGRHLKSHLGIKSHTCDSCGAQFVDGTRLKQHKWIHLNYRAFKCTVDNCQESFRHKSHLKSHLASFHTNSADLKDKTFDCHLCNRKFAYQYKLKNHIDWHKMENSDLTKNKQNVEIDIAHDESVYVCAICRAEFITIDDLGKHCQVHYEDKVREDKSEDMMEAIVDISNKSDDQAQTENDWASIDEEKGNKAHNSACDIIYKLI